MEDMKTENKPTEQPQHWLRELEEWLPQKINGIAGEGADVMVSHEYVPNSVQLQSIIEDRERDPSLTEAHLVVKYLIKQVDVTDRFRIGHFWGSVEIPIAHGGSLLLSGIDPIEGMFDLQHGLTDPVVCAD
jgi:hypothetical protein